MFSLFNFSSIFPADPICPYVRMPMLVDDASISVVCRASIKRSTVRPSHRSITATAAGGFAAERPASSRRRSLVGAGAHRQRRLLC